MMQVNLVVSMVKIYFCRARGSIIKPFVNSPMFQQERGKMLWATSLFPQSNLPFQKGNPYVGGCFILLSMNAVLY